MCAVLRESLGGHEERAEHPVGKGERQRGHGRGDEREPAEEQADCVVGRLAEHVQVGPFLGAERRDVVGDAHHPEREGGSAEVPVEGEGERDPGGAERGPLDVGDGQGHQAHRDRAMLPGWVHAIGRAVEDFVEDVVAGGDEARGGQRQEEGWQARPAEEMGLVEQGHHGAENHERVLEPVVHAGNLDVGPEPRRRAPVRRRGRAEGRQGTRWPGARARGQDGERGGRTAFRPRRPQ